MIDEVLLSSIRLAIPLIFAALGGMLSERSGVANIALEAYLLISAFAGAAAAHATGNFYLGIVVGLAASGLVGLLFAATSVYGRGDQIVVGTAFNLFISGLIPVLCRTFFGVTGSTPSLTLDERTQNYWGFFVIALGLVAAYYFVIQRTRYGLRMTAAGENPMSLRTQGVNVNSLRIRSVVEGAIIAGFGGVFLSMCLSSGYTREMAAGRGFIALAALIFGGWRPLPTLAACLAFGLADAIQIQLQGQTIGGVSVPNQFVQMLPYVITLIVIVFYSRKIRAPRAINRDLDSFASN